MLTFAAAMRFDWTEYLVITAADLTAVGITAFLAWSARRWIGKKATEVMRSGHLYWLASDLTWTEMQVKEGNIPKMLHGLTKSIHHANAMNLGNPIVFRLNELYQTNAAKQAPLTEADKKDIINKLDDIIGFTGKLAEQHQGDFRSDPET